MALIYAPAAAKEMGIAFPDCKACRTDCGLRERWGCDGPEPEEGVFTITCSACWGAGCDQCNGGEVTIRKCPQRYLDAAKEHGLGGVMAAYADFDSHNALPSTGGTEEQASQFMAAVRVIDHERGQWNTELEKYRDEVSKHRESTARRGRKR